MAEPQVLKLCNWPSPTKVYHTPGPGAAAQPATPLGAPLTVAPPVEPVTTVLHSNAMAEEHSSLAGVLLNVQEESSWLASGL